MPRKPPSPGCKFDRLPAKNPKLIVTATRAAEARRIIANQDELIASLKASAQSTLDAEKSLKSYISALKHLQGHERRMRKENTIKKGETSKRK